MTTKHLSSGRMHRISAAVATCLGLWVSSPATADDAAPPAAPPSPALSIYIECEGYMARTKACPTFLRSFVDEQPLLRSAPRADAAVILYVNPTQVANTDRLLLRFVATVRGAPPSLEITVDLDTRTDDDTQRAQLKPAFIRGIALYVAAAHPEAVAIELTAPAAGVVAAAQTTPWGTSVTVGGTGSWTSDYSSLSSNMDVSVTRVDATSLWALRVGGNYGFERLPPLIIDGTPVSIDSDQYSTYAQASFARHLSTHWALGAGTVVSHEDPDGQYQASSTTTAAIEWDKFASDDPRGNRLAVTYEAGYQVDRYNVPNELGERFAHYPVHKLGARASVRKDKITYGLYVTAGGEVIHPERRHELKLSPSLTLQLGAHIDLNLYLSITKRELPGPDIDEGNFNQLSRADYAQALSAFGFVNLTFHWDRTNGALNNRLDSVF